MELLADVEGNTADHNLFDKNSGPGKVYPGGPTCKYKGKVVPCLVHFTPKASIDGAILLDILENIDTLKMYDKDRANEIKSMLPVNEHRS